MRSFIRNLRSDDSRNGNENVKKKAVGQITEKNSNFNFTRASHFFVQFLAVTARLWLI